MSFAFGQASVSPGDRPCSGVIGTVSEKLVEVLFEWKVPDFFSLKANRGDYFDSTAFSYSGCVWYLRLYPQGTATNRNSNYVALYLRSETSDIGDKTMAFAFGVRGSDGKLEEKNTSSQTYGSGRSCYGDEDFWYRSQLSNKTSELGTLTFTCRMKDSVPRAVEAAPPPMKIVELETLSTNLRDLFTSRTRCDVTIRLQNREFHAHKAVLMVRSRVFAAMFEHDLSETETGVVNIEDCDQDSFGDFLHYLYTGRLEDLSFRNVYHLYVTADKYDVKELKSFCVAYMMRNLTARNVCDVAVMADRYGDTGLLSSAQIFFNRNVSNVLSTTEWDTLLKENHVLANKFFTEMASTVKNQD